MKCLFSKSIGGRLTILSAASLLLGMSFSAVAQAPPQATTAPTTQTAPPAAQTAPTAIGGADAATYVIGPEDGLQVTVWKEPTLSGVFPVRPDGMISMTLLGDVRAAGLTPMQLGDSITQLLKKFIQEPSVAVVVTAVNSRRVYLVGEVNKVGPVPMSAGMTALQAIASAGGLTLFANPKHIYILRNEGGKQQKIPFDYKQALKGDSKQLLPLQPGDTIVVP
jgi:polysaccharide export outer membrane protein